MAKFTTRVVLHGVDESDTDTYKKLHDAMAKKGFTRQIKDSDGIAYEMPPAEYNRISDKSISEVRDDATDAAKTVWKDISVLVTSGSRSWYNLKKA